MRRAQLALVALALLALQSCTALQWQRAKAHGAGVGLGVLGGAAAVVTGGTAGLVVAGGGFLGGVVVDQAMEPDPPEAQIRTVAFVIRFRTDAQGNTTQDTKTYVDEHPGKAPPALNLGDLGGELEHLGFLGQLWRAVQWAWWLLVAGVVLGWLARHTRILGRFGSGVAAGAGLALDAVARLRARLRKGAPPPPTPPQT